MEVAAGIGIEMEIEMVTRILLEVEGRDRGKENGIPIDVRGREING